MAKASTHYYHSGGKNTNNLPHDDIYDTLFAILKILCNLVLEMNTYFASFYHVPTDACSIFFKNPKLHVRCMSKILT